MTDARTTRRPSTTTPRRAALMITAAALAATTAWAGGTVVTFDNGPEGWSVNGNDTITPAGGNPGAYIDHYQFDTFGIEVRTSRNFNFLGDYGARGPVTLACDFEVITISNPFDPSQEFQRNIILELRDFDNPPEGFPWVSVWYNIGLLPGPEEGWHTYEVEILDPNATDLPPGWGGYGAEDPDTFAPILPADRTFKSVLASVDQVVFTTFEPGFFYGFTTFDVNVDNISIQPKAACTGDVNGDGATDSADLSVLIASFGQAVAPGTSGDLNGDGIVDSADLSVLVGDFGCSG